MLRNLFAAVAVVAALVLPITGAWSKDDKACLREAIQDNLAEIDMGRLAQRRSSNPDVKAFGKMLVPCRAAAAA
jgi:predicted outer membrane protein